MYYDPFFSLSAQYQELETRHVDSLAVSVTLSGLMSHSKIGVRSGNIHQHLYSGLGVRNMTDQTAG